MPSSMQLSCKISNLGRHTANAALAIAVILLPVIVATWPAQAQVFTTLAHIAQGGGGIVADAGVAQDAAGNLYGTTAFGGVTTGVCGSTGCGTVFKLDTSGKVTMLHSFTGSPDGTRAQGGLLLDAAGNVYGVTGDGGAAGAGTVFKLDAAGNETVVYTFTGTPDGASPRGPLVRDAAGNFYGVTSLGGTAGDGTVFKLDTAGKETVLHSFTGAPNGAGPASLVRDESSGNLYGTAGGGASAHELIFKLDTAGTINVLYTFSGNSDGDFPQRGLFLDTAGNLFGTTSAGGLLDCFRTVGPQRTLQPSYCGTVFKLDTAQRKTVLHSFTGPLDGSFPAAGLVQDAAGEFFGTTAEGGSGPCTIGQPLATKKSGCGTIFKLDTSGNETVLYNFTNGADGMTPAATLLLDSVGNLYGTTLGTVFKLVVNDFSVSAAALTPGSVSAGGSATSALSVTAVNAFSGSVALTCSVQPMLALAPTCSISPSSATPGTAATLTVRTTGPTPAVALSSSAGFGLFYALWLPLIGLFATRVRLGPEQKVRKAKLTAVALVCALSGGLLVQIACGGGSSSGGGGRTPAGTYTVTVTGADASGSLKHSTTAMLTVQ